MRYDYTKECKSWQCYLWMKDEDPLRRHVAEGVTKP